MSDSLQTICPSCQRKLKLKSESAFDKILTCPGCKTELSPKPIHQPVSVAAAPQEKAARSSAPASRQEEPDEREAPVRKKKKRKPKKSEGLSPTALAGIIVTALVVVIGGGIFIAVKMMPKRQSQTMAEAVELTYEEFNHPQAAFRFEAPAGWEVETGGKTDNAWVKLTKGESYIRISRNMIGSITMSQRNSEDGDLRYDEVNEMHRRKSAVLAEDSFKNFKEDPPQNFDTKGYGPAAMSAFTGGTGTVFTTKIKGIHGTAKGSHHQVDIVAICPEKQFETLRPAFEKAVRTLQVGLRQ